MKTNSITQWTLMALLSFGLISISVAQADSPAEQDVRPEYLLAEALAILQPLAGQNSSLSRTAQEETEKALEYIRSYLNQRAYEVDAIELRKETTPQLIDEPPIGMEVDSAQLSIRGESVVDGDSENEAGREGTEALDESGRLKKWASELRLLADQMDTEPQQLEELENQEIDR